ncbi:hypothetical protein SAMN05216428_102442 [Nitrosospira sp. Nsp11]|uniref:hypothetical protein n=1 Tax=Nitrosospira sp. Nsp11 TaxID=1855338 RepID=UPI00091CA8E4|nr:hypothetical protein [Nitrosospira sp. Nsp11]SHL45023.1 hypothetical protein SAMN05216428_102442 [Nitrosospira sp. Nsp11]
MIIRLVAGDWCTSADRWLGLTGAQHLPEYKAQFRNGARLLYVLADGVECGAVLVRIDVRANGADGVIVAAGCRLPGVDLVAHVLPALESLFLGVDAVRVHTSRPGLVAKLKKSGYEQAEVVMVKKVTSCIYH